MIFGTRCLLMCSYGIRGTAAAKADVRNKIEPELLMKVMEPPEVYEDDDRVRKL